MREDQVTVAWLREACWLTPVRAQAATRALAAIVVVLASLALGVFAAGALENPNNRPAALDFDAFWAAAGLGSGNHPERVYDNKAIEAVERAATVMPPGYLAFYYPPTFLLLCLPLGLLGFASALIVFVAAQYALIVLLLRRVLSQRWAMLPIVIWPGFLMNALSGQNGCLSAACFAGYMVLLKQRPAWAGACLGALVCKPQLAACVPIALLAARRWRALAGCVATAFTLAAASFAVFGDAPWRGFIANAANAQADLETLAVKWPKMQSTFAAIRLLGGGITAAYGCQVAVSLIAVGAVVFVAWRRPGSGSEASLLAVASVLFTPFLYDYDLTLLSVPLVWMAASAQVTGWMSWEKSTLAAIFVLPLFARLAGMTAGLTMAPPLLLCLLALVARRALFDRSAASC